MQSPSAAEDGILNEWQMKLQLSHFPVLFGEDLLVFLSPFPPRTTADSQLLYCTKFKSNELNKNRKCYSNLEAMRNPTDKLVKINQKMRDEA